MLEILGILVAIGVFVFWCDVTDSWNNVFRWAKTRMDAGGARTNRGAGSEFGSWEEASQ